MRYSPAIFLALSLFLSQTAFSAEKSHTPSITPIKTPANANPSATSKIDLIKPQPVNLSKAAEDLINAMDIEATLKKTSQQIQALMIQKDPCLAPVQSAMQEFFDEVLDPKVIRKELIALYTNTFSESELTEILKFYLTPVGKKYNENLPMIAITTQQMIEKRINDKAPELFEKFNQIKSKLDPSTIPVGCQNR